MRKCLTVATILLLASCGQGGEPTPSDQSYATSESTDQQAAEAGRAVPPDIAPTSAPGVAFDYRYVFRLPSLAIGPVQEQHAQACEKLGTDRCRIVAMRYTLVDEDDVQAELSFKLDPALARAFGRQGIEAVSRAEGLLTHAEITGTDVGAQIAAAARTQAQMREELERIEARLAQGGVPAAERAELQAQAAQLRQSLRGRETSQAERREMLANTPVHFTYRAGDTGGPLAQALDRSGENFVSGLAAILVVLITLLPWAVAILLIWLAGRWLRRRFPALLGRQMPPEA